ncbi:MAG TPA: GNAT family N-acetyltransferase [Alphaproteobacteria bacterium]
MTLKIRNASYGDYSFISDLFRQANAEHVAMRPDLYRKVDVIVPQNKFRLAIAARDLFGYQPVSLQVAEIDGQKVGAVFVQSMPRSALSWSIHQKEAYVDNIAVIPEFRQQGVATKLADAAKAWAKATGHTFIYGKIITANEASLRFAEKMGVRTNSVNVGIRL